MNTMNHYQAIDLLSRPSGASIKEFQERLNVSRRTVYRILDRLQDENFPIYQTTDSEGKKKWMLEENYLNRLPNISLPNLSLNRQEILLLNLMLGSDQNLDNSDFFKVRKSLRGKITQWLEVVKDNGEEVSQGSFNISSIKTGRKNYLGSEQVLDNLLSAIKERKICRGRYYAPSRQEELMLELRPLRIYEWRRGFYVFCLLEPELPMRMLAIERFLSLEKTSRNFPPPDVNPEKLMDKAFGVIWDDPITVKIHFTKTQAPYVKARLWAKNQHFDDMEDGSTILSMTTSGYNDVLHWILGFGTEAKVLEPESLAKDVINQLEATRELYS